MSQGFSCRSPTLVPNFSPLSHSEHCTRITLRQHHFKPSWKTRETKNRHQRVRPHPDLSMKPITLHHLPETSGQFSNKFQGRRHKVKLLFWPPKRQFKNMWPNHKVRVGENFFDSVNGSRITAKLVAPCSAVEIAATMSTWSSTISIRTARNHVSEQTGC